MSLDKFAEGKKQKEISTLLNIGQSYVSQLLNSDKEVFVIKNNGNLELEISVKRRVKQNAN